MLGVVREVRDEASDAGFWLDEYGDFLYAFALSRVRNVTVAEDLVQDTLLAAMQSKDTFAAKSSQKTWLCGILKHKVVDYFRRNSRETYLSDEESDMSSYDYLFREGEWKDHWTKAARPIVWDANPEKVLEHSEFRSILSNCLGELPERIANCFALREMDGFDSSEICSILGVSPNNYWVMMHRARMHLRRCIDFNWFRKNNK